MRSINNAKYFSQVPKNHTWLTLYRCRAAARVNKITTTKFSALLFCYVIKFTFFSGVAQSKKL